MNENAGADEDAFLTACLENPDDDTARLVYADWLDENSEDPRNQKVAAFLRLATQRIRMTPGKAPKGVSKRAIDAQLKQMLPEMRWGWPGNGVSRGEHGEYVVTGTDRHVAYYPHAAAVQVPAAEEEDDDGTWVSPPDDAPPQVTKIPAGSFVQLLLPYQNPPPQHTWDYPGVGMNCMPSDPRQFKKGIVVRTVINQLGV